MADESNQHIVQQFDDELTQIESMLFKMGDLVDAQMQKVLRTMDERNIQLAEEICAGDTPIDDQESAIDYQCALVIAKRQPTARDMRMIISTMRSIYDLERIGDEITKIAREIIAMKEEESLPKGASQVQRIGHDVATMLKQTLIAMSKKDVQAAVVMANQDTEVDKHCHNAILTLSRSMAEDSSQISSCINLLWIVRSLERIGDRACNLTEHVVYLMHGKDIRHLYNTAEIKKIVDR